MRDAKRTDEMSWEEVQRGNRSWWSENPMAYDWHGEIEVPRFSREWFRAVDERFLAGARLALTADRPFDRVLPYDRLSGARVLEIGCGMGLHTELMVRAGADVTSIDLSPTSIEATQRRLELAGLRARVELADAERLPAGDRSFDLVWSWGVIHHSARTGRVVREIARVVKATGEARVMVYNREGTSAKVALVRDHLLGGRFLTQSFEETLYRSTDGFSARYYVREQFEDLFRTFFRTVSSEILGQVPDALPLPRRLRALVLPLVPERVLHDLQRRFGSFLFLTSRDPE
jgi:2-polyprenyl-3-methyl-5-hydroxy-6-metoxy-1,4-benzoquinol methylase